MLEKFGLKGTEKLDIFFSEKNSTEGELKKKLVVEISRQNANLSQLKEKMAMEAKAAGANAIINFKYGQRAHQWWEKAFTFKWDTESWYGEGDAVFFSE